MAGKAKNMRQRRNFLGGGEEKEESRVRDIAPHSLGNLGAKTSLKCHSLIFRPILCKSVVVIFRQQLKTFNFNNFTLSSTFSLQNAWPRERKAVYTLVLFHIFIHFPAVRIGSDHHWHIF